MSAPVKLGLVPWEKTFADEGTFAAIHAARRWLAARGYSVGTMCGDLPMGVMLGDFCIAKWRNLTPTEVGALDGKIVGDFRAGPVTVRLKSPPDDAPPSTDPAPPGHEERAERESTREAWEVDRAR